jgi:NAD(P)-dependent dehydrogenase (short-subunit alcohol dehydrogenase family)
MSGTLQGKFALVTGVSGAGQVGYAVAEALAAAGAALCIAARNQGQVDARAADLRARGARVAGVAADLTQEPQVDAVFERMAQDYGRIDIVVNLAGGLTRYKPAIEHSLADWQHEVGINLLSAFLCSRAALKRMSASGGGAIINFARAGVPQANMVAYNCAKAGIEALTRTLALEGRDAGIRVNAVAPGLVDTESNIAAMKPKDTSRWAKREQIARATVFLASDESSGVTGQILPVTGWGI